MRLINHKKVVYPTGLPCLVLVEVGFLPPICLNECLASVCPVCAGCRATQSSVVKGREGQCSVLQDSELYCRAVNCIVGQ